MVRGLAKTIEIFLPEGDPKGIKVASITSRSVQVCYVPRAKLDEAKKRESLSSVGVYFLVGSSDEHSKLDVYIGEAENCIYRLNQHNSGKDFWQYALIVTSKTNQFTKVHGKFLEWLCYSEAKQAERCNILNGNIPNKPHVGESMEADIYDSYETASVLISTLGLPIFQKLLNSSKMEQTNFVDEVFTLSGRGGDGSCIFSEEGIVVLRGSRFAKTLSPSMEKTASNLKLRNQLISENVLVDKGDHYFLVEDTLFPTPSNAAASVTGHSTNGWTAWKRKNGQTLSDVYRPKE